MTTNKHNAHPVYVNREYGYIGELPYASRVGVPLVRQIQYLLNFLQNEQWYTYSGPGYTSGDASSELPNPHHDYGSEVPYYVILHAPEKADTSNSERQLGGVLLPWSYDANSPSDPAKVTWQGPSMGSAETIWEAYDRWPVNGVDVYATERIPRSQAIQLWNTDDTVLGRDVFQWTPDNASEFEYGTLKTKYIRTAALGIWPMPDVTLTDDQMQISTANVAADRIIRGLRWQSGSLINLPSLGDMIQMIGDGSFDHDCVENATKRCLLQTGHPRGITCNETTYKNIRGDSDSGSTFKVRTRNLLASTGTIATYPALVLSATNASGGNPGYVKYTSITGSDTWTLEVTSNTLALYDYSQADGGSDTLAIDADDIDEVRIEVQAPTSGTITIWTYSLWEPSVLGG